ncbi:MAG: hypothetical protein V4719_26540 [Planctomycetota bacterium]
MATLQQLAKQYTDEMRFAVVAWMEGDKKPFIAHCIKHSIPMAENELVIQASICKTVTGNAEFPMELRTRAKQWLQAQGLSSFDDGDVPG